MVESIFTTPNQAPQSPSVISQGDYVELPKNPEQLRAEFGAYEVGSARRAVGEAFDSAPELLIAVESQLKSHEIIGKVGLRIAEARERELNGALFSESVASNYDLAA